MENARSFWKGFLLAAGLGVVFVAGRVSAGPEMPVLDVADEVRSLRSELQSINRTLGEAEDELENIRRSGIDVRVAK